MLSGLFLVGFVFNGFIKMLPRLFQLRKPSCREPVEEARSVCAEMVRSMLAVSWLSRTAHMAECVGQEKLRQRGDTIRGLHQERGDTGD